MWLGGRWVVSRLQNFTAKEKAWGMCRYKNLQRAYRRQGLKALNKMKQDELNIERKVCKKKRKELQQTAPYLWVCHLQQSCSIVLAKGDVNKVKALLELIKKQRKSKRWRRMKNVTGKKRGKSVLSVKPPLWMRKEAPQPRNVLHNKISLTQLNLY